MFENYDSNINNSFMSFDLTEIFEQNFEVNFGKFLVAKRTDNNALSENEVGHLLESMSAWRHTMWYGYVKVKRFCEDAEDALALDMAVWSEEAKNELVRVVEATTGKNVTPSAMKFSKEEIFNWILREYTNEWQEHKDKINKYKDAERLLYGAYQNLVSRGMELQSLLKGKQQRMDGNIYVQEDTEEYDLTNRE